MIAKLRFVLSITMLFVGFCGLGQQNYWEPVIAQSVTAKAVSPGEALFDLNIAVFSKVLDHVNERQSYVMQFPDANGKVHSFMVRETPIFHPDLSKKYPEIKSFTGVSSDGALKVKFSTASNGIQGMLINSKKGETSFLKRDKSVKNRYEVYRKQGEETEATFICGTKTSLPFKSASVANRLVDGQTLRTYRIAVSTTGEYSNYHGGTVAGALAAINATLTRVNAVFETDLGVRLQLVPNNDQIIFTDASTDPYSGNFNAQVQNTLTNTIGEENYDVGHLFHRDNDNGNAGFIGSVCVDNRKGSAFASALVPEGDSFDLDYVAHELGHQFGANHTWSFESEGTGVQVEPASGTTIMGYAGIVNGNNLAPNGDDYFHHASIVQIQDYLETTACAVSTNIGNSSPSVSSLSNYVIPKGTPFVLTANAIDADGDMLTYAWEQIDNGIVVTSTFGPENISGANFRSLPPSTAQERYFPNLNQVLNGNLEQENPAINTSWETVSNVQRELNFALTVRDNNTEGGQVSSDSLKVEVVSSAGPFQVTSQNANEIYIAGSVQEITWDVANTNQLPINTESVSIWLSTDGGNNFSELLANDVPNVGSALVQLPGTASTNARIMVRAQDNVYFAVNSSDLTIVQTSALLNFDELVYSSCQPNDFIIPFSYESFDGFSETMNLSINSSEAFTGNFSQPTVSANTTDVTLTLGNIANIPVGTHIVEVIATGSTFSTSTNLEVQVFNTSFEDVGLSSPSNGLIGTTINPSFIWEENVNHSAFDIEIAVNDTFTTIVETATVSFPTYQSSGLQPETTYYWRIRPRNDCGQGTFSPLSSFTTSVINCAEFDTNDLPQEISAEGTPTISSIIFIPQDLRISDLDVNLEIAHTFLEDLTVTLTSPSGTKVTLLAKNCGNLNNIIAVFDDGGEDLTCSGNPAINGTIKPLGSLASFNEESTFGEWILEVEDSAVSDGGSLDAFSLDICVEGVFRPDEDEDGVFDDGDDLCLGTPKGTFVDTSGCPLNAFPANNFSISIQSEACRENNDGSVLITATDVTLMYNGTLTGTGVNTVIDFTNETTFSNLSAGTYRLCINGTDGVITYRETCFDVVIEEPNELSVLSNVLADDVVRLQLQGGIFYNIEVNGEVEQTIENEFLIQLKPGLNRLKVSTGLECQGVFEKEFFITDAPMVFPNPTTGQITVGADVGNQSVLLYLFTSDGRLVKEQSVVIENYYFDLDLSELANGLYYLVFETGGTSQTVKLIKR